MRENKEISKPIVLDKQYSKILIECPDLSVNINMADTRTKFALYASNVNADSTIPRLSVDNDEECEKIIVKVNSGNVKKDNLTLTATLSNLLFDEITIKAKKICLTGILKANTLNITTDEGDIKGFVKCKNLNVDTQKSNIDLSVITYDNAQININNPEGNTDITFTSNSINNIRAWSHSGYVNIKNRGKITCGSII